MIERVLANRITSVTDDINDDDRDDPPRSPTRNKDCAQSCVSALLDRSRQSIHPSVREVSFSSGGTPLSLDLPLFRSRRAQLP